MTDSLVAINLIHRNTKVLYNDTKNNEPILYYWTGEIPLDQEIIKNKKFINKYLNKLSFDEYINLDICYFYIDNTLGTEEYISNIIRIKDVVSLSDNYYNSQNIINDLIVNKIKKLYFICFKENYKENIKEDINYLEFIIKDIYNKINNKYPNKLSKESYINWIRADLVKDDQLHIDIIDNIMNNIKLIFNN